MSIPPRPDPINDAGRAPIAINEERMVLGAILGHGLGHLEDILPLLPDASWFADPNHGLIYNCMIALAMSHGDADGQAVAAELKRRGILEQIGGRPYLAELVGCVPGANGIVGHAGAVREAHINGLHLVAAEKIRVAVLGGMKAAEVPAFAAAELADIPAMAVVPPESEIVGAADIANKDIHMKEILIGDVVRRGETMNVVSVPKIGKTKLLHSLAIAVATGGAWLGHQCAAGGVLICDNELHRETLAMRLRWACESAGVPYDALKNVDVMSLRGKLRDLHSLGRSFRGIPRGKYSLVIIDSLYRAWPANMDENSNAAMTGVYNDLDSYAKSMDAAICVVHHASKGTQSGKSITDVGSGAGAQARAADTHLIIRPHEVDDVVVVEANTRSFAQPPATCWRVDGARFVQEPGMDPSELRQAGRRKPPDEPASPKPERWDYQRFTNAFITATPKTLAKLQAEAIGAGVKQSNVRALAEQAVAEGLCHKWKSNPPVKYCLEAETLVGASN